MTEQPQDAVRFVVARTDDIPPGERRIVAVGGRTIGILNIRGEFHALLHTCPHSGGPLCDGALVEYVYADRPGDIRSDPDRLFLSCPWHGWLFDVKSGQSWWDPTRTRARLFPVEVMPGEALVNTVRPNTEPTPQAGPYVVETFPVTVEDDYIVVTLRPRTRPGS
jgi:3-phenylpropionate/trans-cinnamate dioxygenase ferredoxin subunit